MDIIRKLSAGGLWIVKWLGDNLISDVLVKKVLPAETERTQQRDAEREAATEKCRYDLTRFCRDERLKYALVGISEENVPWREQSQHLTEGVVALRVATDMKSCEKRLEGLKEKISKLDAEAKELEDLHADAQSSDIRTQNNRRANQRAREDASRNARRLLGRLNHSLSQLSDAQVEYRREVEKQKVEEATWKLDIRELNTLGASDAKSRTRHPDDPSKWTWHFSNQIRVWDNSTRTAEIARDILAWADENKGHLTPSAVGRLFSKTAKAINADAVESNPELDMATKILAPPANSTWGKILDVLRIIFPF